MFAFLQGPELIAVAVVVLVLFGGTQLPLFAKNLGQEQKEFKKGLADGQSDKSGDSDSK
jgi:sec-independent protein translocase protein TatA